MRHEMHGGVLLVNGEIVAATHYERYHQERIAFILKKLVEIGARRIVEVGGHPWVMTARLIDEGFEVCATISAEEITQWPDDIGLTVREYHLRTPRGHEARFPNYSANVERTLFDLDLEPKPDTAIACEIIEHLIRAPHVMFLNINRWLPLSGKLLVTTPNGAQFSNPLRRRSQTPAYRCSVYERHHYLYTLNDLVDLIELCGFRVSEAGFFSAYRRQGPSRIYDLLARLPGRYFREKFQKSIYVVGEKVKNVRELDRTPWVYDPRGEWEYIRRS